MSKTTVIAAVNQKGGVGKTTSVREIAQALMQIGKSVLAIDFDPQASLSIAYALDPGKLEDEEATIGHALLGRKPLESLIISGKPDIIPASIQLSAVEIELQRDALSLLPLTLRDCLAHLRESGRYDYILIDCPPTLGFLLTNALVATDGVVVPVKTDYLSVMAIKFLFQSIQRAKARLNTGLQIVGIIPTMYNARNTHDKEMLAQMIAAVPHLHVFGPIHRSTNFDNSTTDAVATLARFPNTPGVENYKLVGEKIVEIYG